MTAPAQPPPPASPQPTPPFPPKRVLVPLDFSGHSLQALPFAEACARAFGSRVIVLNVMEPATCPTDVVGCAPVITVELSEDLTQTAQAQLDGQVARLRQLGFAAEGALRTGSPQTEIAATASEMQADLVVVTTHGYTGLKHVLLGSTAERVVRHAPCPVLVVRENAAAPPGPAAALAWRRILVPVDFSAPSHQALAYAAGLARQFGAALTLTHVVEPALAAAALSGPDGGMLGAGLEVEVLEQQLESSAGKRLAALAEAEGKGGLPVAGELLTGTPWSEIAGLATRVKADLIVAGTHGYTGLKHVLLGGTAERIVRHAPCPVLVVRGAAAA